MHTGRPNRALHSFSPIPASSSPSPSSAPQASRPPALRRIESSESDESFALAMGKSRNVSSGRHGAYNSTTSASPLIGASAAVGTGSVSLTPIYTHFTTAHPSSISSSPNFSRPGIGSLRGSADSLAAPSQPPTLQQHGRVSSPLTIATTTLPSVLTKSHARKHSSLQGTFETSLPSTTSSSMSPIYGPRHPSPISAASPAAAAAAQAAVMYHQQQQQTHASTGIGTGTGGTGAGMSHHLRQRSQTVPSPSESYDPSRRGPAARAGPVTVIPPLLSFTDASGPRDGDGFASQSYHNGLLGSYSSAATAAANVVFTRSSSGPPAILAAEAATASSPSTHQQHQHYLYHLPQTSGSQVVIPSVYPAQLAVGSQQMTAPMVSQERLPKPEKTRTKLFSRPGRIGTKGEAKDKALASPGKSMLSALQRTNFSTTSLAESVTGSFYQLSNLSSATVRAADGDGTTASVSGRERERADKDRGEKEKEKDKRHHFLSRSKLKLKDEFHLPLSSAASNSKPSDPAAPSSLYNFSLPPSPGPTSTSFPKSIHVAVRRDKRPADNSSRLDVDHTLYPFAASGEWQGSTPGASGSMAGWAVGGLPQLSGQPYDAADPPRYGLSSLSLDDAWPYLKAKLLVIFEGEEMRLPVEDLNRVVAMHVQFCCSNARREAQQYASLRRRSDSAGSGAAQRSAAAALLEDLRDLLAMGFASIDRTLRAISEDRVIMGLVELWLSTFTSILPYLQSVFLPLDLEFAGCGSIVPMDQVRDFWGGGQATAAGLFDVRRLVLTAFRDVVMLPRYEMLKTIFSRLSLEFLSCLPSPVPPLLYETSGGFAPSSTSSDSLYLIRPDTALSSFDPASASFNSNTTTLLGDGPQPSGGSGQRSRAISNVSFGSGHSDGGGSAALRPFTPSTAAFAREQNVEDSKQVADMIGRLLQCTSVLASLGASHRDTAPHDGDDGDQRMDELCKMLKHNWLGRGRTGRNRRGIVGGRVRRDPHIREEIRAG